MTEFEFLSVMISIIFGLGLTHILGGSLSYIFSKRATETHLVYSAFALVVLVLNWWVVFIWHNHTNWSFDEFLVLVLWAISHYLIAITLYPPDEAAPSTFESHRNWFFWSFFGMTFFDMAQTAMRGDLFNPWYYLIFVLHYSAISLLAVFIKSRTVHRVISWWFLSSIVVWSLVVRRFLA
jgi:hypothetical protein